jgi:hypothetical protein
MADRSRRGKLALLEGLLLLVNEVAVWYDLPRGTAEYDEGDTLDLVVW